jgi:hypothetical protein
VALGDEAHLPPPPPQVSPLLQCLSVEHATVCPPQYPSTIAVNRDTMYAAWLPPTG